MSGRGTALAGTGLVAGLAVAGTVAALLHRTLRPVAEIDRYADATLAAAGGIARNLDGASALLHTGELATRIADVVAPPGEAG